MVNKVHPDVNQLIQPIVYDMTRIKLMQSQQMNRVVGKNNEPEDVKLRKRSCVHILYDGSDFQIAAKTNKEGKLVCECCGREIGTKFDDDAVKKISDALPVINQLLLFGMMNGLQRKPIENLLVLKNLIPDAAQLMSNLCEYVKNENERASTKDNVGYEYQSDLFSNSQFTSMR